MNVVERINDGVSTSAARAVEIMQVDDEIASILTSDCAGIDCVRSYVGYDAINVPVDVETMVQQLPRQLDNDQAFSVNTKNNKIHESTYLRGLVKILDSYNSSAIVTERYSVEDDTLIGYKNHTEAATAKLDKMSVVELGRLPYKIPLAVGYPCMITINIDDEDVIVNGAIGVLKNIELLGENKHYAELEAQDGPSTSVATHKQRLRL
ncbi:hypothetical protein TNCV_2425021 [Trichonephila clavipes]|nr:hypothetical protein TNCV_2425021 [Trichonephila clavipes]